VDNKRTHHQTPQPEVRIYNPDDGPDGKPIIFDLDNLTTLQSYAFSVSVNDAKGEFSLTFHPDDPVAIYGDDSILDQIHVMDIVRIYETEKDYKAHPNFTGVIRQKKYVIQMTEKGPKRSVLVSGHSIAGLVQEFKVSLDLRAMLLTGEIANEQQLSTELTISLIQSDNKPLPIKTVIEKIWKHFLNLSTKYGKLSNSKVAEYVTKWMGEDCFQFDDSEFYYPLGNIFRGQNTQSFYDLTEGIVPKLVYENFPYTENGQTKIVIRQAPFDMDVWGDLEMKQIDPCLVKGVDIQQSDNEVYTVYYAYIDGYPIEMDKALILHSQSVKGVPMIALDDDKFGRYGYRPLFISLRGYGKSHKDDTNTADKITELSNRLKEWFCNLDKMYSGKITMSTDITANMPQAGEKISFLGGEFYVTAAHHSWNYGNGPETTLAVSRGGNYSDEESEDEPIVVKNDPPQFYTVQNGDSFISIANNKYGSGSKAGLIYEANREKLTGRIISLEGYPTIYGAVSWSPNPNHVADVLIIPPDPDKSRTKPTASSAKKGQFHELKNMTKRYQEFKDAVGWEEWAV
jgi:hypothetical protein